MKQYYPKNGRVILHVDMNSFFASVEMAYDASLKGKPIAVAGNPEERKGIVVTCSYEARKFGVKTTMTVWEAKKRCPQLIILRPNFTRYREASEAMFRILRQYSELVEPVSIDEGYIDITESYELGTPYEIATMIQQQLVNELDLPCSIGIAPNKFLAKMASDMKKPMGITVLRKRDIPEKIWPLPLIEMHGIGKKTADKLVDAGIQTIKDLAHTNDLQLEKLLGIRGLKLKEKANGVDLRVVDPNAANDYKSVGSSTTLPKDSTNQQELLKVLEKLSSETATRMKKKGYLTNNVSITIKYKNRSTITRSRKLNNPVVQQKDIYSAAKMLFLKHWNGNPVRLLGVTGQDLVEQQDAVEQLNLFSYEKVAMKEPLYQAIDKLREKYGENAVQRGVNKNKK
ncbi:DNA polymerase IV [Heyndrickxia sporothermodurans]|uniref:DNA polymerase IV n=1 Tax=Heyndrickxia sporothermodurans TaxID=46224 RepID=A0A150KPB6_9BACI|nr:DNA polymerase IV [Heyndrickxia sporothermodurans]KYC95140.1 DNA polymerase IV [Heyndrickxia sporothermodurans]MEB6547577.1 DNA polymerase IV [Heyndrickxia sporothermodurans]MED3650894.1 DNA polymerase IV [Heyndrickxia sporothermodurans]MED3699659.1 DNA polymerase IV [Heyndrickxia sporothermodurans]MED3780819.1 DNA polymerase IV [Heyndrickxia sporothermodurans]